MNPGGRRICRKQHFRRGKPKFCSRLNLPESAPVLIRKGIHSGPFENRSKLKRRYALTVGERHRYGILTLAALEHKGTIDGIIIALKLVRNLK